MIYPQSFPNMFSDFSEETFYELLLTLPEEEYYAFFMTDIKVKNKPIEIDVIILHKEKGVLLIEIKGGSYDKHKVIAFWEQAKEAFAEASKQQNLLNLAINTAVWQFTEKQKQSPIDFKNWIDAQFVEPESPIGKVDFNNFLQYIKKNNRYYTPSGSLSSFNFQNYKGIKKTSINNLPTKAPWVFVTGENGFGKTCLLQAIAMGLTGIEHSYEFSFTGTTLGHEESSAIKLEVTTKDEEDGKNTYNFPKAEKSSPIYRNICAYGASRLDTYDENNSKKNDSPILSLFDTKTLLRNIELDLVSWHFSDLAVDKQKYEHTKKLLEKLLGGIEISITKASKRVWYREVENENHFEPVIFDHLAAGYRSLIAMVGDIIIRMFENQPDIVDPSEFEGIIIIDELDLHWHPKWQRKLPGILGDLFPHLQFIVSTHSPIPLLGAPEKSVFLKVNRTVEEGITVKRLTQMEKEIKNLLPNIILTSPIFDMDDIKPVTNKDITKVRVSDSMDEEDFYKLVDKKLEELLAKDKDFPYDKSR